MASHDHRRTRLVECALTNDEQGVEEPMGVYEITASDRNSCLNRLVSEFACVFACWCLLLVLHVPR